MYEAKLLVEVGGGTGSIEYSVGTMSSGTATAIPTPKSLPSLSRAGGISWANGRSGILSLLSLDGSVVRSARKDASHPGTLMAGGLPKGLYVLRFQGERGASETSKLLLP
jgi:hypothetical protein